MTTRAGRTISVLLAAFVFLGLVAKPAHAYFDPGTGSILVQALVAGFAGVGVVLKLFWQRVLGAKSSRNVDHDSPNR